MIPRLISSLTETKKSYGIDPFLDGEHQTSWPKHDHYKIFLKIINTFKNKKYLKFKDYSKYLNTNYSLIPRGQNNYQKTLSL